MIIEFEGFIINTSGVAAVSPVDAAYVFKIIGNFPTITFEFDTLADAKEARDKFIKLCRGTKPLRITK